MRLTNAFTVAVAPDRVWDALLDIERVASLLPGATIESSDDSGEYRGTMRMKVGPMTVGYRGAAKLGTVDVDARTAAIEISAKELKGHGTATAVLHNRVLPEGDGTRVIAETELAVTGRPAQFGRGIMEDVAGRTLAQFARRLEDDLLAPGGEAADGPEQPARPEDDALALGHVLLGARGTKVVVAGGVSVVALLIARALGRRRDNTVTVRFARSWS